MEKTKIESEKDRKLDKTLEDTFPASDPSSDNVSDKTAVRPVDRQPAPVDLDNVKKLADEVKDKLGLPKDDRAKS